MAIGQWCIFTASLCFKCSSIDRHAHRSFCLEAHFTVGEGTLLCTDIYIDNANLDRANGPPLPYSLDLQLSFLRCRYNQEALWAPCIPHFGLFVPVDSLSECSPVMKGWGHGLSSQTIAELLCDTMWGGRRIYKFIEWPSRIPGW